MFNQLDILFTGYSRTDDTDADCMRANCTCTLIRTRNGRNIIVDTMTAWDGERLLEALAKHNIQPADIHVVVCTHGHSDHIGCNYLFTQADWHIVGACASKHDKYITCFANDENFKLDGDEVVVMTTPGHTLSCVSVLVRNSNLGKMVGICGDLFESEEDIFDATIWLNAGSEHAQHQKENRLKMSSICDYIVPGHGPGFQITQNIREKLRLDVTEVQTK